MVRRGKRQRERQALEAFFVWKSKVQNVAHSDRESQREPVAARTTHTVEKKASHFSKALSLHNGFCCCFSKSTCLPIYKSATNSSELQTEEHQIGLF